MSSAAASPVRHRFLTPGVVVLLGLLGLGAVFALRRFVSGIGAVSNLDDQHPWGIWIAVDVASGVALAAGGFTTAALVHIFNRHRYHPLMRPALLTALLGYTFVVLGLLVDLGKFYNVWHPLLPSMWSGHSVLFEVGICVTFYLTVLYIEFLPIVVERLRGRIALPGVLARLDGAAERLLALADRTLGRLMWIFIILGVLLSCLHQSSLGALMVIVPYKMHPLWHTPILPLLFLLSAVAVGFPMVIVESLLAARSFGRRAEMELLAPLAKVVPPLLTIYCAFKVGDLAIRGVFPLLLAGGPQPWLLGLELLGGVVLPWALFLAPRVRRSPNGLLAAALLVVLGVVLNRINVFLVAYDPPYAETAYTPSFGELVITLGLVAGLVLAYRALVTIFPVLPAGHAAAAAQEERHVEKGWTAPLVAGGPDAADVRVRPAGREP